MKTGLITFTLLFVIVLPVKVIHVRRGTPDKALAKIAHDCTKYGHRTCIVKADK